MRIIGLDYGTKTVGGAVADMLGITAQRLEIIRRPKENHMRQTFRRMEEIAEEYQIESVVLGYPLNMDDTVGDRAEKTLAFRQELEKRLNVPVFLVDERLTTVEADEIMEECGIPRKDFKKYVDMIAAEIILQDYLNMK